MSQMTTRTYEPAELEEHRVELRGFCYRMLGSAADADDAVQDTMVKAWQALDRFEGRSSTRSWLYRIATNVCLDALRSRQRRALPMDLSSPVPASTPPTEVLPHEVWVEPVPDDAVVPSGADPALRAVQQDTIRLAFVAALQHLPPRQRAVLVLREVLCWQASEVAELLETTVASVNSALQRARATLSEQGLVADDASSGAAGLSEEHRDLLSRYTAAFEAYDIASLVTLLKHDAGFSMPPLAMWLQGPSEIADFYLGHGAACEGSRLLPIVANGMPAFGHYKPAADGGYEPWAIQVIELSDGRIRHLHHFLDTRLFARFGLPPRLEAEG